MANWIKVNAFPGGATPYVQIDFDPDSVPSVGIPEVWGYAEIHIPAALTSLLPPGSFSRGFFQCYGDGTDDLEIGIVNDAGTFKWWASSSANFGTITADTTYRVEYHAAVGETNVDIKIDGVEFANLAAGVDLGAGLYTIRVEFPLFDFSAPYDGWVGVKNLAYSLRGWISDGAQIAYNWDFEGADPLNDANAAWSNPPFLAGAIGTYTTVEVTSPPIFPGLPGVATFLDSFDTEEWFFGPPNEIGDGEEEFTSNLGQGYNGIFRGKLYYAPLSTGWGAQRLDFHNGGDTSQTYWISYAFALEEGSWANLFTAPANKTVVLPGFAQRIVNPFTGYWWNPTLTADSASTGYLTGALASFTPYVTEGVWHTLRFGLRLNGAASFGELWLDNALIESGVFNSGISEGPWGVIVQHDNTQMSAPVTVYIDELEYGGISDPGEAIGGVDSAGNPMVPGSPLEGLGAGLIGHVGSYTIFQSYPWRAVVADGSLLNGFDPHPDSGGTITLLDRLASNRRMNVAIGKPRTFECDVPSDNPEINIPYDDIYAEAFLAEGNRLLFVFRRETEAGSEPEWIIRGSFIIMQIEDEASAEEGRSHLTAYDPRQLLYARKALNPVTGDDIGRNGFTYINEQAGNIAYDIHVIAEAAQGTTRIVAPAANVFTTPAINEFTIQQGMSVGEVWDELEATGNCEIYLEPIYDPVNNPGMLCEMFIYEEMGEDNPAAIFAWDKPSLSLLGVSHLIDGTQRANSIRFAVGQGGLPVNLVQDADSIDKFGEYWAQQWFPVQKSKSAVLALAAGDLDARDTGRRTVSMSPAYERSPVPLRDYNIGDRVQVAWSNRLRQPLLNVPNWSRIVEIPIDISDDVLESVAQAVVEPTAVIFPLTRIALDGPELQLVTAASSTRTRIRGGSGGSTPQ